jgi:energy-coupling factor transporter ATP-binding protein EcfA2
LHIIEDVLAELQITANAMLEQVGLLGWELRFEAERETKKGTLQRGLNVFVKSPHNEKPVKWESWSGGEGQRLRVLGALALGEVLLNRAGVEPTLEVLDEPTSHLSPQGVQDMIDMLHDRAASLGRTVLYADQTAIASDQFASVLTVERSGQGTRICEG